MTLEQRAAALAMEVMPATGLWPEENQALRRNRYIPAILAALEETRREALEEAIAAIRADHHRHDYTTFAEIAIRALIDAPRQGETQV